MEGRYSVTCVALTAIIFVCWVGSTSCYKLDLDDAVKNDMRNLTCESYCIHCNCTGTFVEPENKCVCSCDDLADSSCLTEVEGMRDLIGLNYAIEIEQQLESDDDAECVEDLVRVSRQAGARRRNRSRRPRGRRTRGRRPRRPRRGRRPGRTNLVGASAPTPPPPVEETPTSAA